MKKYLKKIFEKILSLTIDFKENKFHPLVWINGTPIIEKGVFIGGFSEINCKNSEIFIGENSDIASFVAINCADSHKKTIGINEEIVRKPIYIGKNVFVGSHCVIKGGTIIGNNSVLAAGTVIGDLKVPDFSLVYGNPAIIKEGYYKNSYE